MDLLHKTLQHWHAKTLTLIDIANNIDSVLEQTETVDFTAAHFTAYYLLFYYPIIKEYDNKLSKRSGNDPVYFLKKVTSWTDEMVCRFSCDNPIAYCIIGLGYQKIQPKRALHYYHMAQSFTNCGHGAYFVGLSYYHGTGGSCCDMRAARSCLKQASDLGHPHAQLVLAKFYYEGLGGVMDRIAAREWLLMAAQQNVAKAYLNYADFCEREWHGCKKTDALIYYEKAAKQHEPRAEFYISTHYLQTNQIARGLHYLFCAGNHHYVQAQFKCGEMYANGKYIKKNNVLALEWYAAAAAQDILIAQTALKTFGGPNQFWFPQLHKYLSTHAHQRLWLILMAAGHFCVQLPPEIWEGHILSCFQRKFLE